MSFHVTEFGYVHLITVILELYYIILLKSRIYNLPETAFFLFERYATFHDLLVICANPVSQYSILLSSKSH